jgi:hypothetical protein
MPNYIFVSIIESVVLVIEWQTYNYLSNQCLPLLTLWVRTLLRPGILDTALCDKVCRSLAAGRWISSGTPVSSTNKTDRHDITDMLLKVTLDTITLTLYQLKHAVKSLLFVPLIFQLYRGSQFYWRRKVEYRNKSPTWRKSMTYFIT